MRALLVTLWFVVSVNAAPDLILRNGLIYDGTGRAPFKGDIAIVNGRIIAVGNVARAGSSRNVIDANGLAIAPGFIDTDMTSALPEEQRAGMLGQVPLGRLGVVDDIAAAVAFLASPGGGYITGETLHVNGGMLMD